MIEVRRGLSEGPPMFRGWLSPYSCEERRDRNEQIIELYLDGVPVAELAGRFRLSRQRVWQVLGPREGRPPRRKHKRRLNRLQGAATGAA